MSENLAKIKKTRVESRNSSSIPKLPKIKSKDKEKKKKENMDLVEGEMTTPVKKKKRHSSARPKKLAVDAPSMQLNNSMKILDSPYKQNPLK